jgi:hypothetical protein
MDFLSQDQGRTHMSFLRFSRPEYQAILLTKHSLGLGRRGPHALQRGLVRSLAPTMPELAQRISRFRRRELRILHEHLRERQQPSGWYGLDVEEFSLLAEAFGPYLFSLRFIRPLKRALVEHFQGMLPGLSAKLEQLSHRDFEELCEQLQQRAGRGIP